MHGGFGYGPSFFFPAALFQFVTFLFVMCALVLVFAVHIVICALLYGCYSRIPRQFRKQEAGLVWLLLIPCFHLVWNFFVYPRLADSYKAYFASVGRTDVGDCGRGIGLAYSICAACCIIPCCFTGMVGAAALVLLIIFLVKVMDLKSQIPPQGAA